jgi:hypothetical protein
MVTASAPQVANNKVQNKVSWVRKEFIEAVARRASPNQ